MSYRNNDPLGGDLSGNISTGTVTALQGHSVSATAPTTNYVLEWNGSAWTPTPLPATVSVTGTGMWYNVSGSLNSAAITLTGDVTEGALSGTNVPLTVIHINGASVPAAGSLTTGNVLQVNGTSSLTYAAVNLAGGSNFVTGVLPAGNQAAQTMSGDVTGTTASSTVAKIQGNMVTSGALVEGNLLIATSTSNWASTAVTGDVFFSNVTPGFTTVTALQNHNVSSAAPTSGQVLAWSTGSSAWVPSAASGTIVVGQDYSFGNVASSDFTTYSQLENNATGSQGDISTTASTKTLLKSFITPISSPDVGIVAAGTWQFDYYSYVSANSGTQTLYFDVFVSNNAFSTNGFGNAGSLAFSSPTVTLTDATGGFTSSITGQWITVSHSTTPANNGTFQVTFVSSTQISWSNASGAVDSSGTVDWFLSNTGTGSSNGTLFSTSATVTTTSSNPTVATLLVSYPTDTITTSGDRVIISVSGSSSAGATLHFLYDGMVNASLVRTPIVGAALTLSGDVTGITSANTVQSIKGFAVNFTSPLAGNTLSFNGTSWVNAALNLAGGSNYVTGNLPVSNIAPGTSAQVLMSNGTPTTTWTTISGDATISNTGVVTVTDAQSGNIIFNSTSIQFKSTIGNVSISQAGPSTAAGSNLTIQAQDALQTAAAGQVFTGGALSIISGAGSFNQVTANGGNGGALNLTGANGGGTSSPGVGGTGAPVNITAGTGGFSTGTGGNGGVLTVAAGNGGSSVNIGGNGGNLVLTSGDGYTLGSTPGTNGNVLIQNGGVTQITVAPSLVTIVPSVTMSSYGTGVAHFGSAGAITSSTIVNADVSATANIAVSKLAPGTSAQVLMSNGTPATTWTTFSQDVTLSATGAATVGQLQGSIVLSGTPSAGNVLVATSPTAAHWTTDPATVTWASDLSGNSTSTNSNQYVSSLSYSSSASGGPIAINGTGTSLVWAANNTNPVITQTAPASSSSAGTAAVVTNLTSQTGGATTGSSTTAGAGGNIVLGAGAGGSGSGGTNASGGAGGNAVISSGAGGTKSGTGTVGAAGNISLQLAGTELLSFSGATPGNIAFTNTTATVNITQTAQSSTSGASGTAGKFLSITAQAGQSATGASHNGGSGATFNLTSGTGGSSGSAAGGQAGLLNIMGGAGGAAAGSTNGGTGGAINVQGGTGGTSSGGGGQGGEITITGGTGTGTGLGGFVEITGGTSSTGTPGHVALVDGNSDNILAVVHSMATAGFTAYSGTNAGGSVSITSTIFLDPAQYVSFGNGGAVVAYVDTFNNIFNWTSAIGSPVISQDLPTATNTPAAGTNYTIQAQAGTSAVSGTTNGGNGGDLLLNGGTGGTATGGGTNGSNGKVGIIGGQNVTVVAKTASYAITRGDFYIAFGTLSGGVNATLPASPATGDTYIIKDSVGTANTHNITIQGNGNNIDGASTYVMQVAYESVLVVFTGTQWSVS